MGITGMSHLEDICRRLEIMAREASQWATTLSVQSRKITNYSHILSSVIKKSNSQLGKQVITQLQDAAKKAEVASSVLHYVETLSQQWIAASTRTGKIPQLTLEEVAGDIGDAVLSSGTYVERSDQTMASELNDYYEERLAIIEHSITKYKRNLESCGVINGPWLEKKLAERKRLEHERLRQNFHVENGYSNQIDIFLESEIDQAFGEFNKYCQSNNGKDFVPLSKTYQSYNRQIIEGEEVMIFDHPFAVVKRAICNQGSAFPNGPTGTCGCCASGTLLNMACYSYTEKDIVQFALDKQLCSPSGGTSPSDRTKILQEMASLETQSLTIEELSDLVPYIESGHGVIISVSASAYCPEWYGEYYPGVSDGHALVLCSVVRQPHTNDIIGYIVIDSNGSTPQKASRLVTPEKLQFAYSSRGSQANVTQSIIW